MMLALLTAAALAAPQDVYVANIADTDPALTLVRDRVTPCELARFGKSHENVSFLVTGFLFPDALDYQLSFGDCKIRFWDNQAEQSVGMKRIRQQLQ